MKPSIYNLYKGLLITGKEGYGTTDFKYNLQKKIIQNNFGLTIVDYTGKNTHKIIKNNTNIIHIEPSSFKYGFNILNCPIDKSHNQYEAFVSNISNSLTNKINKELENPNTQISNIIYTIILKCIKLEKEYTLRNVAELFENNLYSFINEHKFDNAFINRVKNYDETVYDEIYEIIIQWIQDKTVENFISKNNLNLYNKIKQKDAIILDLSKLQNYNSKKHISNFFLNRLWNIVQTKITIKNNHFLFLNDYHNGNYDINHILSDARKYKLGICISVKHINQMLYINKHHLSRLKHIISFNTSNKKDAKTIEYLYNINAGKIVDLHQYEYIYYNTHKNNYSINYVPDNRNS